MQPDASAIAHIADCAIAQTATARKDAHRAASELLAANDNAPRCERVRFRGQRPAWNWLARKDAQKAAALWLVARGLLPADNDNHAPELDGVDMRPSGTPRAARRPVATVGSYLDLPAAAASPLAATGLPRAVAEREWWNAAGFAIKPQRDCFDFRPGCRFGYCAPAVAAGAMVHGGARFRFAEEGQKQGRHTTYRGTGLRYSRRGARHD